MAGKFIISRYESDVTGSVHPIRIQEETLDLEIDSNANDASATTTTVLPSAQVSRGKRSLGINARTVTVKFTATKAGYKDESPITLPWLTKGTVFNSIKKGDVGTYLGTAIVVVGTSPEKVN